MAVKDFITSIGNFLRKLFRCHRQAEAISAFDGTPRKTLPPLQRGALVAVQNYHVGEFLGGNNGIVGIVGREHGEYTFIHVIGSGHCGHVGFRRENLIELQLPEGMAQDLRKANEAALISSAIHLGSIPTNGAGLFCDSSGDVVIGDQVEYHGGYPPDMEIRRGRVLRRLTFGEFRERVSNLEWENNGEIYSRPIFDYWECSVDEVEGQRLSA